MSAIRVLVADDASVIRRLITDVVNREPDMEVVGVAEDGVRAIEQARALRPDVITLDVDMPVLDGLGALAEIRRFQPTTPIVMFSTLTIEGGVATLAALSLGASDFVAKPPAEGGFASSLAMMRTELIPRIRALAERRRAVNRTDDAAAQLAATTRAAARATRSGLSTRVECVVIAVSTGGPNALEEIVPTIPATVGVPILVVQHMPPTFTGLLASRLERTAAVRVREATDGQLVEPGTFYIAPGGRHLVVTRRADKVFTALNDDPPENSCRPSADALFRSAVAVYGSHVLAVVLTGMGEDGLAGSRAVVDAGGHVLAQDQATSVVWGMPGAVVRAGLAAAELPLSEIVPEIVHRTLRAGAAERLRTPR